MAPERVEIDITVSGVALGWAVLEGGTNGPSPAAMEEELSLAVAAAPGRAALAETAVRKAAVRDMLRHGAYKPTGRGKPASEYLLAAAIEGRFPRINILADINNLVSLDSLLPISVVDLEKDGTRAFRVRRGAPGEFYVFNPSGQTLDLEDLLLMARLPGDVPCATPVKDCQETKTGPATTGALVVVYAPETLRAEAGSAAERFAALARAHFGGTVLWGIAP